MDFLLCSNSCHFNIRKLYCSLDHFRYFYWNISADLILFYCQLSFSSQHHVECHKLLSFNSFKTFHEGNFIKKLIILMCSQQSRSKWTFIDSKDLDFRKRSAGNNKLENVSTETRMNEFSLFLEYWRIEGFFALQTKEKTFKVIRVRFYESEQFF